MRQAETRARLSERHVRAAAAADGTPWAPAAWAYAELFAVQARDDLEYAARFDHRHVDKLSVPLRHVGSEARARGRGRR